MSTSAAPQFLSPLHPMISIHVLHTVLYTFLQVLTFENLFSNQKLLLLLIIMFILVTFILDSGVIFFICLQCFLHAKQNFNFLPWPLTLVFNLHRDDFLCESYPVHIVKSQNLTSFSCNLYSFFFSKRDLTLHQLLWPPGNVALWTFLNHRTLMSKSF